MPHLYVDAGRVRRSRVSQKEVVQLVSPEKGTTGFTAISRPGERTACITCLRDCARPWPFDRWYSYGFGENAAIIASHVCFSRC